jgi:hypothetical protein
MQIQKILRLPIFHILIVSVFLMIRSGVYSPFKTEFYFSILGGILTSFFSRLFLKLIKI